MSNTVVKFGAQWCVPCKRIEPILTQIADENPDLVVTEVDVDQEPGLAKDWGVTSVPTVYILDEDNVVSGSFIGARPKSQIERFIFL